MKLSRDDILKAKGPGQEEVEVPEWGGSVIVRGMTAAERDVYESQLMRMKGNKMVPDTANMRARMVVMCVMDPDRPTERMFQYADADEIGGKSGAAVARIFDVASRLSGMQPDDVEAMTRDFTPTASSDSSSSSPSASE